MLISINGGAYSFLFSLYYNEKGTLSLSPAEKHLNVTCREEEIRLGIKPTVRGVLVKAAGKGTLKVSVSGRPFTDIVIDNTSTRVYRSFGEVSIENPQLSINSTDFDGYITKAHMNFTYAEGSPL